MTSRQDARSAASVRGDTALVRPTLLRGTAVAWPQRLLLIVPLSLALAWSYWPTLKEMLHAWETSPDYSHGYLVVPLALYFLWARRDTFPAATDRTVRAGRESLGMGLLLIVASIALRVLGARLHISSVDGWSLLVWLTGVVWIFGGRRVLWWSAPSLAFLWFMIPLPWSVERWVSLPLQRVATEISTWTLQCLGQPAFAQGNVISLGTNELEVAQACSGLRIFVGIAALAFAYCVLIRNSWWKRAAIVLSTIPIALIANASRIVATGMLYQVVSVEAGRKFSHDVAGWFMIPFAAALFAGVLAYLNRLFPEVELVDTADLMAPPRAADSVRNGGGQSLRIGDGQASPITKGVPEGDREMTNDR